MKRVRIFYATISNSFSLFLGYLGYFARACVKVVRLKGICIKIKIRINKIYIKKPYFP